MPKEELFIDGEGYRFPQDRSHVLDGKKWTVPLNLPGLIAMLRYMI